MRVLCRHPHEYSRRHKYCSPGMISTNVKRSMQVTHISALADGVATILASRRSHTGCASFVKVVMAVGHWVSKCCRISRGESVGHDNCTLGAENGVKCGE